MLPDRVKNGSVMSRIQAKLGENVVRQIEEKAELTAGQVHTVQMVCKPDSCPYGEDCPIESPQPGKKCQFELYTAHRMYSDYVDKLRAYDNEKLLQLIRSLVAIEIQLMRAYQIIQNEGFEQYVVTEDAEGKKTKQKRLHNVLMLIDQLENRKVRIVKQIDSVVTESNTKQLVGDMAKIFEQLNKK